MQPNRKMSFNAAKKAIQTLQMQMQISIVMLGRLATELDAAQTKVSELESKLFGQPAPESKL